MPSIFIATPLYPAVPEAPGVPALLRPPGFLSVGISLTPDGLSLTLGIFGPQWGIFDQGGNPVLLPDSIKGFDFKRENLVPTYTQEQGAFQSYNKVIMPFETGFQMTVGGSTANRAFFIQMLEQIVADTQLYTVVTPEYTWQNANLTAYDQKTRTSDSGVTLITFTVKLIEIRNTATASFTKTAQPSGSDQQNGGTVQPQSSPDLATQALGHIG